MKTIFLMPLIFIQLLFDLILKNRVLINLYLISFIDLMRELYRYLKKTPEI